jgi:hypothetical protein
MAVDGIVVAGCVLFVNRQASGAQQRHQPLAITPDDRGIGR